MPAVWLNRRRSVTFSFFVNSLSGIFHETNFRFVSDHLKAYFFERAPTWPAGLNANQRRGMGSYGIIQRLERPQNAQA